MYILAQSGITAQSVLGCENNPVMPQRVVHSALPKRSYGLHVPCFHAPPSHLDHVFPLPLSASACVPNGLGRVTPTQARFTFPSQRATDPCTCTLHVLLQAIDIWMGACTAFIFAALLEFTLTNYLWRKGKKGHTTSSR